MNKPPKLENAPGHTWNILKRTWELRWQADTVLVRKGYVPKSCRVWHGTEAELDATAIAWIQDRCNALQGDMRIWARGGIDIQGEFDGTIRSLIVHYQTHKFSPYKKIRAGSRETYNRLCRRIMLEHGKQEVSTIDSEMVMEWHEKWMGDGKVALASSLVTMLRSLLKFGGSLLKNDDCRKLKGDLHDVRFPGPKAGTIAITAEEVMAFRAKARELGHKSMALAQAAQWDFTFRQRDVVGEWVPLSEPVPSDVVDGNRKWIRGIRWNELNQNLVLSHVTSKRLKRIEIDARLGEMFMEELRFQYGESFTRADLPGDGPIIVSEATLRPYSGARFRTLWRQIAKAAGIPDEVCSMHTRAGAITEALRSGASLDAVRKSATHSNASMTQRYSRGDAEDTAKVMQLRAEHRNKSGTKLP